MGVAENIMSIRKAAGLTQGQLGERVGVARQTVAKWENGTAQPDLSNLKALARELDVSLDTLVGLEPPAGKVPFLSRGKHQFGTCKIGSFNTVRLPEEAMELFDLKVGDELLVLGNADYGIGLCTPDRMRFAIKALEARLLGA